MWSLNLKTDKSVCISVCSNPNLVTEEYLFHAADVWRGCYDCSNNTTDVKPDVSNLEISYFEKLMKGESNLVFDESTNKFRESHCETKKIPVDTSDNSIRSDHDGNVENRSINFDDKAPSDHNLNYFNTLLCSRNLFLIHIFYTVTKNPSIWTKLESFLEYLLKSNFLTTDSLIEQFVALYRQDWPQVWIDMDFASFFEFW